MVDIVNSEIDLDSLDPFLKVGAQNFSGYLYNL